MKILIVVDSFPPRGMNGSAPAVVHIAEGLAARGDELCVLTSEHLSEEKNGYPFPVIRGLGRCGEKREDRHRTTVHNRFVAARTLSRWRPETVVIFGLHRISLGPAHAAEESGLPVLYGMNDEHLADYLPGRFSLSPKRFTGFLLDRTVYRGDTVKSLQLRHSVCTSGLLKIRLLGYGAPVGHAAVIHQGVPCDRFRPGPEPGSLGNPPRILCVTGLTPAGGAHSVVRALSLLPAGDLDPVVTLAGAGDSAHVARLKRLAASAGLTDRVTFTGRIARDGLGRLYETHDVFVFPSRYAEPAGLLHLEAMASGLPVVSTLNGGQREFLRPDENCVCFPAGDGRALAQSLVRLLTDASLRRRLVRAARTLVETSYNLDRYISDLRDLLDRVTREYAACA